MPDPLAPAAILLSTVHSRRRCRAWGLSIVLGLVTLAAQSQVLRVRPPAPADRLQLQAAGRCLEVNPPQAGVEGGRAQLGECTGAPHQTWQLDQSRLVNLANGRCLEVHGPDVGLDGARVQLAACSTSPNQVWRLERGMVQAQTDGRCLETQGVEAERAPVQVRTADCGAPAAQRWQVATLVEPAPAVRQVEAGPIFSTVEAGSRCPAVCAPGRWTGAWRTTQVGRMSVCDCAAPPPPPPPYGRPELRAEAPMDEARFELLLQAMAAEGFPQGKLRVLDGAARDNRFVVAQLRRVIQALTFPSDKQRAVEIMAPRVVDRANAFTLFSVFDFDSEREQARAVFERLAPR